MKNILLVEPQSSGILFIQEALNCGFHIWVATADKGERVLDEQINNKLNGKLICETGSENAILEKVNEFTKETNKKFDLIIPGFEYYVAICAKVSKILGLLSITPENAECCRLKNLMRLRLQEKNVEVPKFYIVPATQYLDTIALNSEFPIIVKAVNMSGSMHVYKVSSKEELKEKVLTIRNTNDSDLEVFVAKDVLLEEYIAGDEFSVEGIIDYYSKRIDFWSVTKKILGGKNGFTEVGHIVEMFHVNDREKQIFEYCTEIIHALNIPSGPFHAEMRWCSKRNRPILMEIAARLAGDTIPLLISEARNKSFVKQALLSLLGKEISQPLEWQGTSAVAFLLNAKNLDYSELKRKFSKIDWQCLKQMKWSIPEKYVEFSDFRDRICTAHFFSSNQQLLKNELNIFYNLGQNI